MKQSALNKISKSREEIAPISGAYFFFGRYQKKSYSGPKFYTNFRQLAYLNGGSLNEYICKILDDIVTRNSETLQKFETAETAARQELKAE